METSRRRSKEGIDKVYPHTLECAPLQKSPKFDLSKEDPRVYSEEDLVGYNPAREWPNIPLPQPSPTVSATIQPVVIPDDVIVKAKGQHDVLVKWLKTAGVDLCKEMEDTENQFVLEAVMPKQKECSICQKKCHNTQRLRAHIRAQHMNTTPFHCAECDKYFSDNNILKLHARSHDPDATKFVCDHAGCGREFLQKGRLTAHKKIHDPKLNDVPCKFACGRKFTEKKNRVAHENYCTLNPDLPERSQCPYCPKDFQRFKDLKRHLKKKHTSRLATFEQDMA